MEEDLYFFTESSSDFSSDDEDVVLLGRGRTRIKKQEDSKDNEKNLLSPGNFVLKLLNREISGNFSTKLEGKATRKSLPFAEVPSRLKFSLKEIVPFQYLIGHVFMGMSACGQYILSYRVFSSENPNAELYDFTLSVNVKYSYSLYFWVYKPHYPLDKYFEVCLFDDHGVSDLKTVSMVQWKSNPDILVVHGDAEEDTEDSYITIVKVPKQGCLDCRKLKETLMDEDSSSTRCIKCNLTVHTKYTRGESDPKFNPQINLLVPERIIIIANGFVHVLYIDLLLKRQQDKSINSVAALPQYSDMMKAISQNLNNAATSSATESKLRKLVADRREAGSSVVESIIADFNEFESDLAQNQQQASTSASSLSTPSSSSSIFQNAQNRQRGSTKTIYTKLKNSTNKIANTQPVVATQTTVVDNANAYEFSEETENCEKIGTFRKKRLADKKYEFSDQNSENIVPFMNIRPSSVGKYSHSLNSSHHHHQPPRSTASHYRILQSPPPPSPSPIVPLQVSSRNKRKLDALDIANITFNTPFLSPRRDDKVFEVSLSGFVVMQDKPSCFKKLERFFVEENDAVSAITSEEDDCISPGYHTSLPLEVHGSSYSEMEMISRISFQKLNRPAVCVTQHSFDLETFTYFVVSILCQQNNKAYDVFYDWAFEIINVCPSSHTLTCMLLGHFTAHDILPQKPGDKMQPIDRFECRILFTWNMETGVWDVIDYGELKEMSALSILRSSTGGLAKLAKTLSTELTNSLSKIINYSDNLKILDSTLDKSKPYITDLDHMVEFHLKRPRSSSDG